jgi:CRISP-associated protein Cas1
MPTIQHLVVDEFGAHIGKYSQRLKVTKKGQTLAQAPLLHLQSVMVANRGVSLSADAIRECTDRGIPIYFLSSSGSPYASLYSSGLAGTVATRREQFAAFLDSRGLRLAMTFGMGKLQNQANLLKYMAKYRKESAPDVYEELRRRSEEVLDQLIEIERIGRYPEVQDGLATVSDLRAELLGLEGRGAQRYWGAVKLILPDKYRFTARVGRKAKDPINSALNYSYGILYSQCERCLVLAGLDPYAGFLHVDRPGKPSLTLDFIEEWRPPCADRVVIGLANRGMVFTQDEQGLLAQEIRRTLAEKVQERLDSEVAYDGKRYLLRMVIQMQARRLAAYLRGEREAYVPYTMAW